MLTGIRIRLVVWALTGRCSWYLLVWAGFDGMNQIRKLYSVLYEENRYIVSNNIYPRGLSATPSHIFPRLAGLTKIALVGIAVELWELACKQTLPCGLKLCKGAVVVRGHHTISWQTRAHPWRYPHYLSSQPR